MILALTLLAACNITVDKPDGDNGASGNNGGNSSTAGGNNNNSNNNEMSYVHYRLIGKVNIVTGCVQYSGRTE
jgi:hypothetical protein